jgi:hypothetical protein
MSLLEGFWLQNLFLKTRVLYRYSPGPGADLGFTREKALGIIGSGFSAFIAAFTCLGSYMTGPKFDQPGTIKAQ